MDEYLEELYQLRSHLKFLLRKEYLEELVELAQLIDRSYVDNYHAIKEQSEHGKDCGYAIKAKELYLAFHERDVGAKIKKIYIDFIQPMERLENERKK